MPSRGTRAAMSGARPKATSMASRGAEAAPAISSMRGTPPPRRPLTSMTRKPSGVNLISV